jgi:hypothetical protein
MRSLLVALAFAVGAVLPQSASAENPTPPQFRQTAEQSLVKVQLPELLQRLGISLIAKAQAAECTAEGETCTSDEQCCPGLECAGGPPATCLTED